MPRKTQKPRKAGRSPLSDSQRRAPRLSQQITRPDSRTVSAGRARRGGTRPPRFPGRLGGR